MDFPIVLIHFMPLKSGQPLYSGQNGWLPCVLYEEVPLYSMKNVVMNSLSHESIVSGYQGNLFRLGSL